VASREVLADHLRRSRFYLAWDGAEAVGTFCLWDADPELWGERPPDALYLHRLAVRRSHAGLGRDLLARAERLTAAAGRRCLRLDCMAGNPDLRAYYERAGFRLCGVQRWPNGWESSLYEKEV
jgi:protein-tyrosine phosphatase